jgi:hypothetical protein
MNRCVLLVAPLVLLGCGGKPAKRSGDALDKAFAELDKNDKDEKSAAPAPTAEDKPKGPVHPAPFTAKQIREATKNGRTYRYKVDVPNKPSKEHVITFRNVDEGGAEIQSGSTAKRMSWMSLQQDAEFPKDKVTTHEEKHATPAGKFDCIVYNVAGEEGEVSIYYFAKTLPGAPVLFFVERNGKRLRTTTLIEHTPGQ